MKTANIYTTTITTSPKNKPIHLKKTSYYMF